MQTRAHKGIYVLIAVASLIARGEDSSPAVAEFTVSETLLRSIEIASNNNTAFIENGKHVNPNIGISARFRLGNADGQAVTILDYGMHGSSVTTGTQAVGRRGRNSVTVPASTNLDADYSQEVALSAEGVKGGHLAGSTKLQLTGVGTSNTFGPMVGRIVRRATLKRAPGMIQAALPAEEQKIQQRLTAGLQQGIGAASKALDDVLHEVQTQMTSPDGFPFNPSLSSRAGGNLSMRWGDPRSSAKEREPKPELERPGQAAASAVLHEDFLVETIGPQIAGKELHISELRNVLCVPSEKPLLDFCKQLPQGGPDLAIRFAETNPISVSFRDGGIQLQLNAVYKTKRPAQLVSNRKGPLLKEPSDENVLIETQPYSIDVSYKLEKDGATLQSVSVRDRVETPETASKSKNTGTHGGAAAAKPSIAAALLNGTVRRRIEAAAKEGFKERIEFAPIVFPTKMYAYGLGTAAKPQMQVTEAGALMPAEMKSENGWLVVGRQFCREGLPPLGVQWTESVGSLAVSAVTVGSAAEAAGLKPGDSIESYGVAGEAMQTPGVTGNDFIAFVGARARGKSSGARTLEVAGRGSDGKPFRRSVTVCPKDGGFRSQAEALLASRR